MSLTGEDHRTDEAITMIQWKQQHVLLGVALTTQLKLFGSPQTLLCLCLLLHAILIAQYMSLEAH